MKMIIAYIQPDRLNDIKKIFFSNNIHRFSITDSYGHSDEDGILESYRGIEMEVDLLKKIKIEVAVNDEFVPSVINAILEGGKSGKLGDGKLFVLPIEECYRIRTGEKGSSAIG